MTCDEPAHARPSPTLVIIALILIAMSIIAMFLDKETALAIFFLLSGMVLLLVAFAAAKFSKFKFGPTGVEWEGPQAAPPTAATGENIVQAEQDAATGQLESDEALLS